MSYQKVVIAGNVGKDCELRYTPQGKAVADFSVATSKTFGKGEGKREETTWWKVVLWQEQAENLSKYIKKGNRILVEGEVSVEAWTDKDGKPAAKLVLTARQVVFMSSKSERGDAHEGDGSSYDGDYEESNNIPF